MNILHVISTMDPRYGGPVEGIVQQAEIGRDRGVVTHVATADHPDDPWLASCPVETFALGLRWPADENVRRRLPWVKRRWTPHLAPWIREHARDYDVVIVDGLWNYTVHAALVGLRGTGVPYAVFTHGMLDPWFRDTYPLKHAFKQLSWLFCEGPLLAGAGAVLFTAEEEKRLAENAFRPYRVKPRVVGYGTSDLPPHTGEQDSAFAAAVPALRGRRYLLFLSRIHRKKGCDLLVEAFAGVAAEHPDVDLVVAGPDQEGLVASLKERAAALGVGSRIHWPSMLSGDAKWGAFYGCEAFVLPSHQENFGVVVAEAMAASKPVLISDKVNIWCEVATCGAGFVSKDDVEGSRDIYRNFLDSSPEERTAMGRSARECFEARYEISTAMRRLLDVLDEVRKEAGGESPHGAVATRSAA